MVVLVNSLNQPTIVDADLEKTKAAIYQRLQLMHEGFQSLKNEGFAVNSIEPMATFDFRLLLFDFFEQLFDLREWRFVCDPKFSIESAQ